jgi:small subunit ribosomal protein S16
MAVKIRLRRTGRKKQPSYRIVVADESTPRDGEYLDSLGTYNPLTKPAELRIDLDRVEAWLAQGARMTDTAASLIRKARRGGDRKVAVRPVVSEVKADTPSVAPAAEPSRSRPGSRGAPRAAASAETPAAETPAAETPAAEMPAAEMPAAEEAPPAAPEATVEVAPGTAEPAE